MDISVIIVNWNTKGYLARCLESIAAAPPARPVEIIVVDNASTDGSPEMVEKQFPDVRLIRSSENLGFACANNLAMRRCSGRYIALVNSDVEVLPGCLDRLAEYMESNPRVGVIGPRILNPDRSLQSSCRRNPTLWNNFCTASGLASTFKRSRLLAGEHMFFFAHDHTKTVDVLVGCFWMMRRQSVEEIGLFDENLFMYGEDLDWCLRCWQAGWQVVFCPDGEAIHHRGGSSGGHRVQLAVIQQTSVIYYWKKHKSTLDVLGIKMIYFLRHVIRYLSGIPSSLLRPADPKRTSRLQISRACIQAIWSGPDSLPR